MSILDFIYNYRYINSVTFKWSQSSQSILKVSSNHCLGLQYYDFKRMGSYTSS